MVRELPNNSPLSRLLRFWDNFRFVFPNKDFTLHNSRHLFHPTGIIQIRSKLHELSTKPPQTSRSPRFVIYRPVIRISCIPMRIIGSISCQSHERFWWCGPMRERGAVRTNNFLRKFGHQWVWKNWWSSFPDVCATVGRIGNWTTISWMMRKP